MTEDRKQEQPLPIYSEETVGRLLRRLNLMTPDTFRTRGRLLSAPVN